MIEGGTPSRVPPMGVVTFDSRRPRPSAPFFLWGLWDVPPSFVRASISLSGEVSEISRRFPSKLKRSRFENQMITIEPISTDHAANLKVTRLRALLDSPTAFGSTYGNESQVTDEEWRNRATACSEESRTGYLAMDGESPCGMVRATPDDRDANIAWVESMWVAPTHRKLGIGRLLINQILTWAHSQGITALKLSVTSNNEPAIRFYSGLGFVATGETEPYPNDPTLVEYVMLRLS